MPDFFFFFIALIMIYLIILFLLLEFVFRFQLSQAKDQSGIKRDIFLELA